MTIQITNLRNAVILECVYRESTVLRRFQLKACWNDEYLATVNEEKQSASSSGLGI